MTARPPKITKSSSLALFAWLEKSQAFFYQDEGPNVRNVYAHSLPGMGGCVFYWRPLRPTDTSPKYDNKSLRLNLGSKEVNGKR